MTGSTIRLLTRDPLLLTLSAIVLVAAAAVLSLPAARAAGPIGLMPVWLLLLPATGLVVAVALRWPVTPARQRAAAVHHRRRPAMEPRRGAREGRRGPLSRAA